MANRFPLIINAATSTFDELAAGDNLDLTSSGIVNAASIQAVGIIQSTSGGFRFPDGSLQTAAGITANTAATWTALQTFDLGINLGAGPLQLAGNAGVAGQVLTSQGAGSIPVWASGGGGGGGISAITAGTGLSGGTITTTGTISLNVASTTALGGVIVDGTTVIINGSGVISAIGGGAAGVTSFNTRTGAVTLQSADITNALGFTPGDITAVNAGTGLTGGGTTGAVTLTLGQASTANLGGVKVDGTSITIAADGTISAPGGGSGTITAVNTPAGSGLSGGATSGAVTLSLSNTGVTAGSYAAANITVDAQGRILTCSNGSGGGGGNTNPIFVGNVTATGYTTATYYKSFRENFTALGTVSGAQNIDLTNSNIYTATLGGTTTFSIINPSANTGLVQYCTLVLKQDATGSRTMTVSNAKYTDGVAPVLTTTPNATDIISYMSFDNGATWIGSFVVAGII